MEDFLREILKEQKESLKKYDNNNIRTRNVTFYPIDNDSNDLNNLLKSEKESIIEENKEKIIDKIISDKAIKDEQVEKSVAKTEDSEPVQSFSDSILNLSLKFKRDRAIRDEKATQESSQRQSKAERNKVILYVYDYLFDLMYNYSLCFDEFPGIISRFPDFIKSIPEIKAQPSKPNTRDFIYKLRTVSLIQKINILAYQIGQYNFSLITDKITDKDAFDNYSSDEFAQIITREYKGTDLDFSALLVLYEIAKEDRSGSIVFEDLKKTEPVKEKEEKIVDKKEQRKKSLGFGSFNLRK